MGLLREALAEVESNALPEHLDDAAEWLGASEGERGKALRGLLRAASRAVQSRGELRIPPKPLFPRFSSAPRS